MFIRMLSHAINVKQNLPQFLIALRAVLYIFQQSVLSANVLFYSAFFGGFH